VFPRNNAPWVAGMAACGLVFLVVIAPTHAVLPAIVLGLAVGLAVVFFWHGMWPSSPDLDQYRVDARRRVKRVQQAISRIKAAAGQLDQRDSCRQFVEEGCQTVLDLIRTTQQKEAGSVASTAARWANCLTDVEGILTNYLKILSKPQYYRGADDKLAQGRNGLGQFHQLALTSMRQVTDGEMMAYQAALDQLQPLPQITM